MKKNEFITLIAEKTGMTKKDAEKAADAVFEAVADVLASGDRLQLTGFGTFKTRVRPARLGRNPKTGEPMQIEEAVIPVFEAGKQLREKVSKTDAAG